jgi:hypothetical protein
VKVGNETTYCDGGLRRLDLGESDSRVQVGNVSNVVLRSTGQCIGWIRLARR